MTPFVLFLLMLTIIVIIHESGHYYFARKFGVKVERASLFFNPFITLLKYDPVTGRLDILSNRGFIQEHDSNGVAGRVFEVTKNCFISIRITKPRTDYSDDVIAWDKKTEQWRTAKMVEFNTVIACNPDVKVSSKWRETQYCIGWLPCGGYVSLKTDDSPEGVLSKKNHQQFLIHFGGILFNIVTVVIALALMRMDYQYGWGNTFIENYLYPFSLITFSLIVFNLLPLPGLDGAGMLLSILNYVLPDRAQSIARRINGLLGILVLVYIVSTWFRSSYGFERRFWDYLSDCFDALLRIVIM